MNDILPTSENTGRPALTTIDHEDRYVIECDLPRVALDDINREVHDGVLEISGERKVTELPEGSSVRFSERAAQPFRRRVKLGKTVGTSSINADFDNGVLVVTALRIQDTLPRKIDISRAATSYRRLGYLRTRITEAHCYYISRLVTGMGRSWCRIRFENSTAVLWCSEIDLPRIGFW